MKRKYHIITYGNDPKNRVFAEITDRSCEDISKRFSSRRDIQSIYGGHKFDAPLVEKISESKYYVTHGTIKDYLNNNSGFEIISSKMWDIVGPYVEDQVQCVPIRFLFENSDENVGYRIINPFICCHAIYREGIGRDPYVIDLERIPENIHVFRLVGRCIGANTTILVSSFLKSIISDANLSGIAWIPTWTKDDYLKRLNLTDTKPFPWKQTEFFIPDFDLSQEFEHDEYVVSIDYSSDDIENYFTEALKFGKEVPESICNKIKMYIKKGTLSDYLENSENFCIVSKRFFNLMPSSAKKNIQCLSLRLFYEKTDDPVSGYVLLNPIVRVDGTPAKLDLNCPGLQIGAGCIPRNSDIVRICENGNEDDPGTIVFSEKIRAIYFENRLRGCRWLPTDCMYPCPPTVPAATTTGSDDKTRAKMMNDSDRKESKAAPSRK